MGESCAAEWVSVSSSSGSGQAARGRLCHRVSPGKQPRLARAGEEYLLGKRCLALWALHSSPAGMPPATPPSIGSLANTVQHVAEIQTGMPPNMAFGNRCPMMRANDCRCAEANDANILPAVLAYPGRNFGAVGRGRCQAQILLKGCYCGIKVAKLALRTANTRICVGVIG